jgi:hypothetical protein
MAYQLQAICSKSKFTGMMSMKLKKFSIVTAILITLFWGNFNSNIVAKSREVHLGKKGVIKIESPTRVGNLLLEAGHYQFQHQQISEGNDHIMGISRVLVFELSKPSPLGPNIIVKEEIGRVICTLEPLGKKAYSTKAFIIFNSHGEEIVKEVKIKGDNFKHVF